MGIDLGEVLEIPMGTVVVPTSRRRPEGSNFTRDAEMTPD